MSWFIAAGLAALARAQAPDTQLERGLAAVRKGDCQAALEHLAAAVASAPGLVPAHNGIGVCQAQLGRPELAAASFLAVVKLEPAAWQGWNNLGVNYLALKKPEQAAAAFREAVKRNPAAQSAWLNLGRALLDMARPEDAFRALDRARRLAPADRLATELWLEAAGRAAQRAADLVESRQYEKSRAILLAVREPLENSASWNNLLGYAEFKLGHSEPAARHLERALQLDPNNEDYLLDIGEFLSSHRAYAKAGEFFEVAARRMPDSPRVKFGLAVANILRNKRQEATESLEALLRERPGFEAAYRALGECYEDAGNWSGMIDLGRKLQAGNASNPVGWYLEGAALERIAVENSSPPAAAIAALERAVRLQPRSSRYHFVLGKAYQEAGSLDRAVAELKQTVRLEPDHERAHYVLGRLYQRLGETALARAELQAHSRIKAKGRESVYTALLRPERNQP